LIGLATLAAALFTSVPTAWALRGGQLELTVVDAVTGQPLACRMHLMNQARKAQKPPKVPFWHDHFVFDGTILLKLPNGSYVFEVERGPEYRIVTGHFTVNENAKDSKTVELNRFADMAHEGWWSGDLEVERSAKDIELLMRAEDLHLAEVVGWGNGKGVPAKVVTVPKPLVSFDDNRCYQLMAGLEQRPDGSLLLLGRSEPLAESTSASANLAALARQARDDGSAWIDVRRGASWDLPIWVALGLVDSIELADSEQARHSTKSDEIGSRPRDKLLFSGAAGIGRWPETVYHHLLNCGLRIPPSAGSGSGVAPNPLGYDRVYVYLGQEFSHEKWFEGLKAGRAMVTNGPLIRPNVEGEMPGHVFQADAGQQVELEVGLTLSTRDAISYLEVYKDGRRVSEVRLDDWAKAGGKLPLLVFKESGWFVIRAVCDMPDTHRFATTAPYYVEIGYKRRISRSSAQFFLDWLDERSKVLPVQNAEMAGLERKARAYWRDLLKNANAD
jgi:hypothetical protein